MIVWRIRGKIIRTVLCCIVYNSCTQWYAHEQFLQLTAGVVLHLAPHCTTTQQQPFYGALSGTTRVSQYQKKHSPTHHPDHHPILISFFHLPRSIASSLFRVRAWQSFCTTSFHVLFGLPHIPHISSPNQCFLFAAHAHTIATCFAVVSILYHLFLVCTRKPVSLQGFCPQFARQCFKDSKYVVKRQIRHSYVLSPALLFYMWVCTMIDLSAALAARRCLHLRWPRVGPGL